MSSAWTVCGCIGLLTAALPLLAEVRNSGFGDGLVGWKASWNTTVSNGEAVLSDAQAPQAFMFQQVAVTSGPLVVTFDFRNGLATNVPPGTFRDSFYVSLYGADEPSQFVLEHDKFASSQGLMDMDVGGPFDVNGTISDSPQGAGWKRFSGTFTLSSPHVVVVFELYDLNFRQGDSAVRIDNVTVRQP